jgi:hypothetical protein
MIFIFVTVCIVSQIEPRYVSTSRTSAVSIATTMPSSEATGDLARPNPETPRPWAFLDPSSVRSDDNVTELALMVGIRPAKLPFRVLLPYTHREEPRSGAVANDSFDLMWHAVW